MENTLLENIPIIPEQYDLEHYNKIDYSKLHSEMALVERQFVNGLIRYYKPLNGIEIGVSHGGGTVNILNAINDIPGSRLISIDRYKNNYIDHNIPTGQDVMATFPNGVDNWELITGEDPSTVINKLPYRYDFAVIDTVHIHPIESLNFLCLLPYMNDSAIVILHDVSFHLGGYNYGCTATRILMSSIAGCKLTHTYKGYEPNIVAFQVGADMRKYIDNVFDSLFLPWGFYPSNREDIGTIGQLIKMHYTDSQVKKYERATHLANIWLSSCGTSCDLGCVNKMWDSANKSKDDIIFYGAGKNMRDLLFAMHEMQINFDFTIWDKNAYNIKEICGTPVYEPNYTEQVCSNKYLVITIAGQNIEYEVKSQFEKLGYIVVIGLNYFMKLFGVFI